MDAPARQKLIVFGISRHAEMITECARLLPQFEFVGFTANRRFITQDRLGDYPLIAFEELPAHYAPAEHSVHVALEYSRQSGDRARLVREAEGLGYRIASIIHPTAIIAPSVVIGPHAWIGESVILQSFARLGANVAINAGSVIGMSVEIDADVYLGTRVTIERYSKIASHCTIGSGSVIAEGKNIGAESTLQPHSLVTSDVPVGTLTHRLLTRPGRIIDKSRASIPRLP